MIQKSTTIGTAGVTASLTKLFGLFGDAKLNGIWDAICSMPIADFGVAITGLGLSIYAIYYKETDDKTS